LNESENDYIYYISFGILISSPVFNNNNYGLDVNTTCKTSLILCNKSNMLVSKS